MFFFFSSSSAVGIICHEEADLNCLSKLFSVRKMEVNGKKAAIFRPLSSDLPIKWLWHMRTVGQYIFTVPSLAFHTKRVSKHIDLASLGRLYGTCFPITRTVLFLWHSLGENPLDWLLVTTEKLSGGKFVGRVGKLPAPSHQDSTALRFTVCARPRACLCLSCLQWLTEDLARPTKTPSEIAQPAMKLILY